MQVVVIIKKIDDNQPYPFDNIYCTFKEVMSLKKFKTEFPDVVFDEKKRGKINYSTYAEIFEI